MLKYLLLALLAKAPHHGYELKQSFEDLLGGTWLLNIGQVYTTLGRLEDDGLIEPTVVPQDLLPDRKVYSLTELGQKELSRWLEEPVVGLIRLREEVFLKIVAQGLADPKAALTLLVSQREEYIEASAQIARRRAEAGLPPATGLILDGLLLRLEADLQWLDEAEAHYRKTRRR